MIIKLVAYEEEAKQGEDNVILVKSLQALKPGGSCFWLSLALKVV